MLESVIMALIYLCVIAIVIYIVIWVLGQLGIAIPDHIMKIIWVIVVLLALLFILRTLLPGMGLRLGMMEHPYGQTQEKA